MCQRDIADMKKVHPSIITLAARVIHIDMIPPRYASRMMSMAPEQDALIQAKLRLTTRLIGCTQVHHVGAPCETQLQRWKSKFAEEKRQKEEVQALQARAAEAALQKQHYEAVAASQKLTYTDAVSMSGFKYQGYAMMLEIGVPPDGECIIDFDIPAGMDKRLDAAFGHRDRWFPCGGEAYFRNMRYRVTLSKP